MAMNMNSAGLALLGLLAVKGFQHRDEIGRALGGATGGTGGALGGQGGGLGGLLGGLGDLLGGEGSANRSGGSVLNQGLGGLLDRFRENGQGDIADSWVGKGANGSCDARQLEQALGEDTIAHLQTQTGLSRQELIERLCTNLPQTVDRLTPEGRLPTDDEANQYLPPLR